MRLLTLYEPNFHWQFFYTLQTTETWTLKEKYKQKMKVSEIINISER